MTSAKYLPYSRQSIDKDDIAAVVSVLHSDWLTTGPQVEAFEQALAEKVGARYTVACSSGTAALHVAAAALGLGSDDVAVVPALTFVGTANAARYVGAHVCFADVDPDTALMTLDHVAAALDAAPSKAVKAIFPVHLNGQCADPEGVAQIAGKHGIGVIEDACHALGTVYTSENGDRFSVGSCGHSDMAVFSFHPVKTIAMGEGGAIATNDESLYRRLSSLRNHGITRQPRNFVNRELAFSAAGEPNPWYYEVAETGFNYRASDIHCALGLSQLIKLDHFVEKRGELVRRYDELLPTISPYVSPIGRSPHCTPAWHLYVALIEFKEIGSDRSQVMKRLHTRGIGTQVHYIPLHLQPCFQRQYGSQSFPGAERYYERALSLPLFPAMDVSDVDRVVDALAWAIDPAH